MCSCGASFTKEEVEQYAKVICQTTSQEMWNKNKDYILSNATENVQNTFIEWFDNTNFSDNLQVAITSHNFNVKNGNGKSMLLLHCANSQIEYFVVLNLTLTNNKISDFSYSSFDSLTGTVTQ